MHIYVSINFHIKQKLQVNIDNRYAIVLTQEVLNSKHKRRIKSKPVD